MSKKMKPLNKAMNDVDKFLYTGSVDKETRSSFSLVNFRSLILLNLFAGGTWYNIISYGGKERVNHPLHVDEVSPRGFGGLKGRRVEITLKGHHGIVLKGGLYFLDKPKGKLWVIVFSGSGGSPEEYCQSIIRSYFRETAVQDLIAGVLLVDYRGFGVSRATLDRYALIGYIPYWTYMPTEAGLYTDAEASLAYLKSLGVKDKDIILHGFSLGSGPATELAVRHPTLGGLILHGPMQSSAYNARQSVSGSLSNYAGEITEKNAAFDNLKKMKDVKIPVCISCGPNDDGMWQQSLALRNEYVKQHKKLPWIVTHGGEHAAPFGAGLADGQAAMFAPATDFNIPRWNHANKVWEKVKVKYDAQKELVAFLKAVTT